MRHLIVPILKKTLSLFLTVLIILLIIFSTFMMTGDPYIALMPGGPTLSAQGEDIHSLIVDRYHLKDPLITQFVYYVSDTLSGDFRVSINLWRGEEISDFIWDHAMVTTLLFISVLASSTILGIAIESWIQNTRSRALSKTAHLSSLIALSAPATGLGIVFLALNRDLDIGLPLLGNGLNTWTDQDRPIVETIWSVLQHAFIPFLACVITSMGFLVMIARSGVQPRMDSNHRYGVDRKHVSWKDVAEDMFELRPFRHFFVAWTMGIVIMVDALCAYDGLGEIAWRAMQQVDYGVLMAAMFLLTMIVLGSNVLIGGLSALAGIVKLGHYLYDWGSNKGLDDMSSRTQTPTREVTIEKDLRRVLGTFRQSRSGMIALVILAGMILIGLLAPVISTVPNPDDPANFEPYISHNPLPPSLEPSPYTDYIHPFGTDSIGRDEYSLFLYETRTAVYTLLEFVVIAMIIGTVIAWIASATVNIEKNVSKAFDFILTIMARTLVTIPIIILIITYSFTNSVNDQSITAYILVAYIAIVFMSWSGMIIARSVRKDIHSERFRKDGYVSYQFDSLLGFAGRSISAVKYGAVVSILTLFAVDSFTGSSSELSWGSSLSIENLAATVMGGWHLILPPVIGAVLLCTSAFVVLDRLEISILKRQYSPTPTDVPQPAETAATLDKRAIPEPNGVADSEPVFGNI